MTTAECVDGWMAMKIFLQRLLNHSYLIKRAVIDR